MKNQLAVAMSIINQVNLPHVPNEVMRLQEESLKQDPDVVVVAECIGRNPRLLTRFLAVASFMSKKEITTARQAVSILGTKGVFTVFFSSAIEFTFQATGGSALIVNHAIKIATAIADLSIHCKGIKSSDAYLFGLLYNVGYIVLNAYDPASYKACYLTSLMNPSRSQAKELEMYDTTSSYIGVYVAKKWRVKNYIYSGILFQQDNVKKCPKGENIAYEMINLLSIARAIVAETEEAHYITEEVRFSAANAMVRLKISNMDYMNAQRKVKQFTKDLESFPEDFIEVT